MQQQKHSQSRQNRYSSLATLIGNLLLLGMAELITAARTSPHHLYKRAQDQSSDGGGGGGSGPSPGAIAGIVCGAVGVAGVVGFFTYRYVSARNRPVHGGKMATVVAMRGVGAMNLQGKMAVLPDDDDFQIGTQQGVVGYDVEKSREIGSSPMHVQASTGSSYQEGALDDSKPIELHSPGNIQVSVVADSGASQGRPLPPTPSHGSGQHLQQPHHHHRQREASPEGSASGDRPATRRTESAGHASEGDRNSESEQPPSAKYISDTGAVDATDPNLPSHPRLFMLTPGRDGIQALHHPENWSRSTFLLKLLCEGTANDYSEAHLTEEHGIAIRDPNAFLIHAARYTAQTADALIARADNVFEQAEMFSSSSEASEYFELLSDTLRAWYSDLLVTMEEAAEEGHDVDQELLTALRAQKEDASGAAKQELGRFLAKYDPKSWFGGLRRTRIQTSGSTSGTEVPPERQVRWLCAACASKATQR